MTDPRASRRAEDIEEADVAGWLYSATWSPEGDSAWVLQKTTDLPD